MSSNINNYLKTRNYQLLTKQNESLRSRIADIQNNIGKYEKDISNIDEEIENFEPAAFIYTELNENVFHIENNLCKCNMKIALTNVSANSDLAWQHPISDDPKTIETQINLSFSTPANESGNSYPSTYNIVLQPVDKDNQPIKLAIIDKNNNDLVVGELDSYSFEFNITINNQDVNYGDTFERAEHDTSDILFTHDNDSNSKHVWIKYYKPELPIGTPKKNTIQLSLNKCSDDDGFHALISLVADSDKQYQALPFPETIPQE